MVDELIALRAEVIRLRAQVVEGVAEVERASLRASITDDLAYSLSGVTSAERAGGVLAPAIYDAGSRRA